MVHIEILIKLNGPNNEHNTMMMVFNLYALWVRLKQINGKVNGNR